MKPAIVLLPVCFVPCLLWAQLPDASPTRALLQHTGQAQALHDSHSYAEPKETDSVFSKISSDSPGCVVAIAQNGRSVFSRAYGLANLELHVPLTVDSVFELESMSKQFTAMDIILLELDGKLSLQDDIHKYVPELRDYHTKITIANLLHHTSGLKDYSQLLLFAGLHIADIATPDRALALITKQKELIFVPGTIFWYSDTNYFLLALIVERISHESIQRFSEERIFNPLGMTHTRFRESASAVIANAASGYRRQNNGWHLGTDNSETLGDSGVVSTVGDLVKWDANFYSGKVGGETGVRLLLERDRLADGTISRYSAGLITGTYRGLTYVEHAGDGPGFQTLMRRYPEQRLAITVLCNSRDFISTASAVDKLSDLYLASQLKPAGESVIEPFDISAYRSATGMYWDGKTDLPREIVIHDDQLMQRLLPDDEPAPLRYVSENHFAAGSGILYTFSSDHRSFSRIPFGESATIYELIPQADLTSQDVTPLAGRFFSTDVQVTWKFAVRSGHLVLQRPGFPDEELQFMFRDAFIGDLGLFRFRKDKQGRFDRLEVMNYRLGRVSFQRN